MASPAIVTVVVPPSPSPPSPPVPVALAAPSPPSPVGREPDDAIGRQDGARVDLQKHVAAGADAADNNAGAAIAVGAGIDPCGGHGAAGKGLDKDAAGGAVAAMRAAAAISVGSDVYIAGNDFALGIDVCKATKSVAAVALAGIARAAIAAVPVRLERQIAVGCARGIGAVTGIISGLDATAIAGAANSAGLAGSAGPASTAKAVGAQERVVRVSDAPGLEDAAKTPPVPCSPS